jgi:GntR family transcriptional regulator
MNAAPQEMNVLFTQAERTSLKADGPIPLYHQLYQLLKRRIASGSISNGTRLPTEQQLAVGFGVSRITAKRVMDLLAADDLIERKRGKGSHVTYEPSDTEVEAPLVGMLEKLASMSRTTVVKVLQVSEIEPSQNIVEDLNLEPGETVHYVQRVRSSEDGAPFAYYESWTRGISHGFTAENISKTQRFAIMAENGHDIGRIEQYLSAGAATAEVADSLGLHIGDPVLTLLRHSYDANGDVVDLLSCQYHPDRFHYRMNLSMEDYTS